jgi:hypothetical protein
MPSLLDIGDLTETVEFRGKKVEVQGISAQGLLVLLQKFPELRVVMTSGADAAVIETLTTKLPEAIVSVIAAGCGLPGDERAEAMARKISVGEQIDALRKIWNLTFPRGIANFIEALEALAGEIEVGESGKVVDTKSPGPSSGVSATDTPET